MRLSLVVAVAAMLSASLAGRADTTITFSGLPSSGFPPVTTYSEGGFTVTDTVGQFFDGDAFGDPTPDLYMFEGTAGITVTANGGGNFSFTDVDFANEANTATYTITGLLNGVNVFSTTGSVAGSFTFASYGSGHNGTINALEISLESDSGEADLDNISLGVAPAPVPEPSSFLLFGTSLFGVAGALRKRFA